MPTLKKSQSWKSSQTDYKIEHRAVYVAMLIKQASLERAAALGDFHTQHSILHFHLFPYLPLISDNVLFTWHGKKYDADH